MQKFPNSPTKIARAYTAPEYDLISFSSLTFRFLISNKFTPFKIPYFYMILLFKIKKNYLDKTELYI